VAAAASAEARSARPQTWPGLRPVQLHRLSQVWRRSGEEGGTVAEVVQGPGTGPSYGDASYWERRYRTGDKGKNQDQIDDSGAGWLCSYAGPLQQTLEAITGGSRTASVLNVGCGMDRLSQDVYADGYTNLQSSDISAAAIEKMSEQTAGTMPGARWFVDDVTAMNVPSQSVDVVLDKGTLDAVLIAPSPFVNAAKMLREVQRVLRVGGAYLLATHGRGDPDAWRLPLLAMEHLSFNVAKTPDLGGYFLFVCTKLEELSEADAATRWATAEAWAEARDLEDQEAEFAAVEEIGQ